MEDHMLKSIETYVFKVDKGKIVFQDLSLSLNEGNSVSLGGQRIYLGNDAEDAKKNYDKLKESIGNGNYRLIIYPSHIEIKVD